MNMNEKTETLMSVMERLVALLNEEKQHLEARQFNAIAGTVDEKDRLCKALELLVRGLVKDADSIGEADQELRDQLHETGTELKTLIEDNMSALKQAISANERLMKAVRDAAIQCTPKAGNYTQSGDLTKGARINAKAPSPVTVNQVL